MTKTWNLKWLIALSLVLIFFLVMANYYATKLHEGLNGDKYYENLEAKVAFLALEYVEETKTKLEEEETMIISEETLEFYGLDQISDKQGEVCNSLGLVFKEKGKIKSKGLLKCKNYISEGASGYEK